MPIDTDGVNLLAKVGVSDAEKRILSAIGCPDTCRGLLFALLLIELALQSFLRASALERVEAWLEVVQGLIDRVEALSEDGVAGLQTPVHGEQATTYGRLCRQYPLRLNAESHQSALTLLGMLVVDAASQQTEVSGLAISGWYTLITGAGAKASAPADWRAFSGHVPESLPDLSTALSKAATSGLIAVISAVVAALGRPVHDPDTEVDDQSESDDIDETDDEGADTEASASPGSGDDGEDSDEHAEGEHDPEVPRTGRRKLRGPLDSKPARENPVGWVIKSANFAAHLQRFDLIGDRDRLHPLVTQTLWRSLKDSFNAGAGQARPNVAFAHISQRLALPARIAMHLRLDRSRSTRLDVPRGEVVWNYRAALDADADPALSAIEPHCETYCIRLALDQDIADYLRLCLADRPEAETLADLLGIDRSVKGGKPWLDQYREYLRDQGVKLHAAYDARFATSLGDVYRFLGANEALAVFLALDFDAIPIGMLHYLTLGRDVLVEADEALFAFLKWRKPTDRSDPGLQGSPISISCPDFVTGWNQCQERIRRALATLCSASNASDFIKSFNELARARLLAFCTLAGHRGTLLNRLTWRSLYQYSAIVHIFDKDVDVYQSDRGIPAHRLLDQVLAAWQGDLTLMRQHAERLRLQLTKSGSSAVPATGPDEPVFFELAPAAAEDPLAVQHSELKTGELEHEAQACFKRSANIGRHFLICQLISRGVSTWHVRVLTGHFRLHAEAFADGSHVPPAYALDTLKTGIEELLDSLNLDPVAGIEVGSTRRRLIAPSGALPDVTVDPYVNPKLDNVYRVLPPPFDSYTTVALRVVEDLRKDLCSVTSLKPEPEFTAAQTLFALLDRVDQEQVFDSLATSIVGIGQVAAAQWQRPGCAQAIGIRLNDRAVWALKRVENRSIAGTWRASAEAVGKWARARHPDLDWPGGDFESFLALLSLALRWRRYRLSPANLTAASPALPSATFSRRSLLRIAGLEQAPNPGEQLGKALRQGSTRQTDKDAGPLQGVADALRQVSKIEYPIGGELQRARDWDAKLKDVDLRNDLRAQALKTVHTEEIKLWQELSKDADETSTLAGHLRELKIALKLLSPRDDLSEFTEQDWREWIEAAKQAVDRKRRKTKAVKRNLPRHFGLKRFVRIARSLGWAAPSGLFADDGPRVTFDGLRQSAASVALLTEDYEGIRTLLDSHFQDWPVLQWQAGLAALLLEHHPLRSSEQAALLVKCLIHESGMLLIAPGVHSHLKTVHAYRLLECAKEVLALFQQIKDGERQHTSRYLFLDDTGWDWSDARLIDEALVSAAAHMSGEASVRKHTFRASATCRLLWRCWEEVGSALFQTDWSPLDFRATLEAEWDRGFAAVALAARSAGHGMPLVSLVYYAAAWALMFSAQSQALLEGLEPDSALIAAVLGSTGTIRNRKSAAKVAGRLFDTWGEVARLCVQRMKLPALVATEERAVITPRSDKAESAQPQLMASIRLVAGMIADGKRDLLANDLGTPKPYALKLEALVPNADICASITCRRHGLATSTQLLEDRKFMADKLGCELLANLVTKTPQAVHDLLVDLAPYRRNPRDAPPSPEQLRQRIESHLQVLPSPLRLQVRFSAKYARPLTAEQLQPFGNRLVVGKDNPRIGRQAQFQVFPANPTDTAKADGGSKETSTELIGRLTVVTRVYLEAIEIARKAQKVQFK